MPTQGGRWTEEDGREEVEIWVVSNNIYELVATLIADTPTHPLVFPSSVPLAILSAPRWVGGRVDTVAVGVSTAVLGAALC